MTVSSADPNAPVAVAPRRRSILSGVLTLARRSPISAFWGVIAALIVLMALSAEVVSPYPPLKSDFRAMQKPPSATHWFGTDQIGRDTLARVIHGSRTSLTVAVGAVCSAPPWAPCGAWLAAISAAVST